MPNNGRITLCPYYRNERALTVTCEDCVRRFRYAATKKRWMDEYCDKDWQQCPYAAELDRVYEEGGNMAEHEVKSLKTELRKTVNRLERLIRSDNAKADDIKKLRKKNKILEDRNNDLIKRDIAGRKAMAAQEEKFFSELQGLSQIYESRLAYLMSEYAGGSFVEADAEKWAEGKEYAIVNNDGTWEVKVNEDRGSEPDDASSGKNEAQKG